MNFEKLAIAVTLLLAALNCRGAAAADTPAPDCASLNACLTLLAQPADPPATEPYGLGDADEALIKKVDSYGAAAIPGLMALLKDPHLDVSSRAGAAIENIQGLTPANLPALVDAAKWGNGWVPGALGLIDTPESVKALLDLVKADPEGNQESQVSYGLQRLKWTALPYLVAELRCKDSCKREYLFAIEHILVEMPQDVRPKGADLAAIVADGSLSMDSRDAALAAIHALKLGDVGVVKAVVQAAAEPKLRADAIDALVALQSKEAVPYLVGELREAGPDGAPRILHDIASLGDAGREGGADVMPYLDSPDWDSRVEAAAALGSIGYRAAIPLLSEKLQGPDWRVSYEAARALGLMHAKDARTAVEAAALHHWFNPVRAISLRALTAIDTGKPFKDPEDTDVSSGAYAVLMLYSEGLPPGESEGTCKSDRVRWHGADLAITEAPIKPPADQALPFAPPDFTTGIVAVDNGWLVSRDEGEFGGGLYAYDKSGKKVEILGPLEENIHGIYRVGGTLLAVGGIAHMVSDHGRVYRLDEVHGNWKASPLVELPGAPTKVKVMDDGHLVISTLDGAVSVDGRGQIASLECIR